MVSSTTASSAAVILFKSMCWRSRTANASIVRAVS